MSEAHRNETKGPGSSADNLGHKPKTEFLEDDSDVLVFGVNPKSGNTLQDAFLKYKSERQKEIKKSRKRKEQPHEVRLRALADPASMWQLRMKFLEQIKKYFGVPYARKYWKPDEPEYSEKLFLDCCGLVRRAMRDLRKDFGFTIGPWNQGYMHDTLPITVKEEDMKPGDLVFISAIFYNPKMKKQKHNLTHVEVWLGDGPKTIGARWHREKVKVFDHYKFESKSYHSMKFIFKSIDTWLMGICRSHCPEHEWKTRAERFNPTKRSIFSVKTQPDDDDEAASDTDANDALLDRGKSAPLPQEKPVKKKPAASQPKKKTAVVKSARSTPSTPSSSSGSTSTPAGRVTVADLREEELEDLQSEDEISTVVAETGSIARDLNEVRSPSPNLQRDFARQNPCEGKLTGISLSQANRMQNQEANQACVSSSDPDSGHPHSIKSQIMPKGQESAIVSVNNGDFESKGAIATTYHVECQTGSNKGDIMHRLNNSDKWKSGRNVMFSCSAYKGEASVQIKTPDILSSSDSASSNDDDDGEYDYDDNKGTYQCHKKSSYSSSGGQADTSHSSGQSDNDSSRKPLSLPPRRADLADETSDSSSSTGDLDEADGIVHKKRTGHHAPSPNQRVSSAASQRSFTQPEVGPLYPPPQSGDSSATESHQSEPHTQAEPDCPSCNNSNNTSASECQASSSGCCGSPDWLCIIPAWSLSADQLADDMVVGGRGAGRRGRQEDVAGSKKSRIAALAQPKDPTFYIAGNNGSSLVESALVELGWKRVTNKYDDRVKLKWVECKSSVNYSSLKEGEQLVNRIPNCSLLTNKLGLLNSLQRYERVVSSTATLDFNTNVKALDFIPLTYRIDEPAERQTFFEEFQRGDIWICKPCGLNQGKGIYLVRDLDEFQKSLEERDDKMQKQSQRPMQRIVQRYIAKPLLLSNRKFDLRAFMLIANTSPYLVCYHKGYARLCLCTYKKDSENLVGHLTNQYIQKQESVYNEYKEETVWSMEKFNQYVNEHLAEKKGLEKDWVFTTLTNQMTQIMYYCFHSVRHKLKARVGLFDLYGFDFMIDDQMKVWLIEINANPCLTTNCQSLEEVLPGMVRETLYLSIECFEKSKRNQPLHPLQCLTNFQIIYDGSTGRPKPQPAGKPAGSNPSQTKSSTTTPRSQCLSPRQKKSSMQLAHPLTKSSPGFLSSRSTSAQPASCLEDTAAQGTAKLYSRSTASTVPTTVLPPATPRSASATPKPGSAKVLSLAQATVGLRGALPVTTAPLVSVNSEVFKFKMTHAALMSSLKLERTKSADKRMLQEIIKIEHAKAENVSSTVMSARSQAGLSDVPALSARESITSATSTVRRGSTPRSKDVNLTSTTKELQQSETLLPLDQDYRKEFAPSANQKALQPLREDFADEDGSLNSIRHPKDESEAKSVSSSWRKQEARHRDRLVMKKGVPGRSESFKYRLTPSPTALQPPAPGPQASDGISSIQRMGNSAPSIPSLKKDRAPTGTANVSNTDGGIIVGVSMKKNERGS